MKQKTINLYSFDELSEDAKETALDKLRYINVDYPDWDDTQEDAKNVGLVIKELSQHRQNKGEFDISGEDTATRIMSEHGENCETYKTAQKFLAEYLPAKKEWDAIENNDGFPFQYEDKAVDMANDFLQELLEDYRIMSEKEYEYLTSDEAVKESIECNEYTFTEDGELENL